MKFFLTDDKFNEWSDKMRLESADIEHVIPGSLGGFWVIYRDEVTTPNISEPKVNEDIQSNLFTK